MKISLKHYLKIYSTTLVIFIVLSGSYSLAQDGNSIISRIQDKFRDIKTIEADFVQEYKGPDGQSDVRLKGTYQQGAEGEFKISTGRGEIISDGKTVWNVDKNQKRVIISSADDRTNSFSLDKIIFEFPELCDVKLEETTADGYVLDLIPEKNLGFKKAIIRVNKEYLVKSVAIEDFNENYISFKLDNYRIDQKIDPATFNFTPDEGIEIIDLR